MKFRFSVKWMLIGVTYASLAVAACSQQGKLWEQSLWLLTGALLLYAALGACLLQGQARGIALGFVIFAMGYGAALWWFPQLSPVTFVASARGFEDPTEGGFAERRESTAERIRYELMIATHALSEEYRERTAKQHQSARRHAAWLSSLESYRDSLNAIGVTLAGLVGSVAGAQLARSAESPTGLPTSV